MVGDPKKPQGLSIPVGPRGRRRQARVLCLQALYRTQVVGDTVEGVMAELKERDSVPDETREFALSLLGHVLHHGETIDEILTGALTRWDLKRVAVTDRCVLRMGAAELLYEPEVPSRVVLDEAIEIAKQFGSSESGRFVNGVLDRVARDHRRETTA